MEHWTVDAPTTLDFDGVAALRVRVVSGSVAVLSTDDQPRLDVAGLAGQPLLVKHDAGILTITYPDLTWDGMLGWLAERLREFVDQAPEFEAAVDRLASWLARLDNDDY